MLSVDVFLAEKIKRVSSIKSLGVLFDENLKCDKWFKTVKNKILSLTFFTEETEKYSPSVEAMQCIPRNC